MIDIKNLDFEALHRHLRKSISERHCYKMHPKGYTFADLTYVLPEFDALEGCEAELYADDNKAIEKIIDILIDLGILTRDTSHSYYMYRVL